VIRHLSGPDWDELLVEHLRRQPITDRIDALLDAVNETAAQTAADGTEGRTR